MTYGQKARSSLPEGKRTKLLYHAKEGGVDAVSYKEGVLKLDLGFFPDITTIANLIENCFQKDEDIFIKSTLHFGEDIHNFRAIIFNFLGTIIRISENNYYQKEELSKCILL